ncbi:MAG TPA: hypothetical protein VFB08_16135 [Burkholderiales bacterium]|nr:hypothetical protein [Burkholderiales bacterium]
MTNRGLLLTLTEPPAAMEEEFNAWYDDEHLPERLSIPGFRSARRWIAECRPGGGKYLATYELDAPEVLRSAEYLARFDHPTPWSRRCLGRALVFRRWACEQVGALDPHPRCAALIVLAGAEAPRCELPGVLQLRRFVAFSGEPRHVALVELESPRRVELPAAEFAGFYRTMR